MLDMKKKIGLEFFAGTQKITKAFNNKLGSCKSLDFAQLIIDNFVKSINT